MAPEPRAREFVYPDLRPALESFWRPRLSGDALALAGLVEFEFDIELDRDGRIGALYDLQPRPDLVVANLLELADALGAPA